MTQRKRGPSPIRLLPAIVCALLLSACVASSDYMHEAQYPRLPSAPPHLATVVFIRPSDYGGNVLTTILDSRGRFLGDSLAESYFAVQVPPGRHVFISWAENTAALQATLAPGRVYYVEVSPTLGFFSPRVHLLALKPGSEDWPEVSRWIADSTQYVSDEASGQAYLAEQPMAVAKQIERAHEVLGGYSGEALAERTLDPGDGIPPQPMR